VEGLKETPELVAGDREAGVGDGQVGMSRACAGCDLDSAPADVVPDRVRDEVGDESLEEIRVPDRPSGLERQDTPQPAEIVSVERSGGNRAEVGRLAALRSLMAPRERETGLEQAFLPPARAEHVLGDLPPRGHVGVPVGEPELQQGALGRQRRTKLVRGVGEEPRL
jgi:hypothetical protein